MVPSMPISIPSCHVEDPCSLSPSPLRFLSPQMIETYGHDKIMSSKICLIHAGGMTSALGREGKS